MKRPTCFGARADIAVTFLVGSHRVIGSISSCFVEQTGARLEQAIEPRQAHVACHAPGLTRAPAVFLVVQLFIGAGNLNPKYLEMLELENFRSSNMSW